VRRDILKRAAVIAVALAVVAVWAREDIHRGGLGSVTVGLLIGVIVVGVGVNGIAGAPAALVLLASVIPYPVSFVAKTPFGVVSAAGALAIMLAVTVFVVRETKRWRGPPTETGLKILLLWVVWAALSGAASSLPKVALNDARSFLFALPLAYLAGRFIAYNRPAALRMCLGAVVIVAVIAIVQAATSWDPIHLIPAGTLAHFPLVDPGESFRNGLVRVRVGYYHASDLGRVLAVALPLLLLGATRHRSSMWLKVGTVLVVIAVVLTWTFTVWLAIGVSLMVFAAASTARGRGAVAGFTMLAIVLVIAVGGPVNQLVESRVHPTGSSLSEAQYRLALIPASIQYADSHGLLGSGPGTFNLERIGYPIDGVETLLVDDNTFTTELVEVGYPGAILFILALAAFAVAWWKKRRSPLYAAALASLVAFVLCSATIDSLSRDAPLVAVALLLGVATGAAESDPDLTQFGVVRSARSSGELKSRNLVEVR